MDKKVQVELESWKDSFNSSIKRSFGEGKPRAEMEENIKNLLNSYRAALESLLSNYEFGSTVMDRFDIEFSQLQQRLNSEMSDFSIDTVEFLCRLNDTEYNKNVDSLNEKLRKPEIEEEYKKSELETHKKEKAGKVDSEKLGVSRECGEKGMSVEEQLSQISHDISQYIDGLKAQYMTGARGAWLMIGELEIAQKYILSIDNSKVAEKYAQELERYKLRVFEAYEKANEGYEMQIPAIGLENKRANPSQLLDFQEKAFEDKKSNPWELSDDYKRKTVEIGKRPTEKSDKDDDKEVQSLESDVIV